MPNFAVTFRHTVTGWVHSIEKVAAATEAEAVKLARDYFEQHNGAEAGPTSYNPVAELLHSVEHEIQNVAQNPSPTLAQDAARVVEGVAADPNARQAAVTEADRVGDSLFKNQGGV